MAELPSNLSKLTVADLKEQLQQRGLELSGRKADLVARLQEWAASQAKSSDSSEAAEAAATDDKPAETAVEEEPKPAEAEQPPAEKPEATPQVEEPDRKRKISTLDSGDAAATSGESGQAKKRKWSSSGKRDESVVVSTDTLKTLIPETSAKEDNPKDDETSAAPSDGKQHQEAVEKKKPATKPPVAPADEAGAKCMLHITKLRRPFTDKQLKSLLSEFGELASNDTSFSLDKIKSQCFVEYADASSAASAKSVLHGMKWPSRDGLVLQVEYAEKNLLAGGQEEYVAPVEPPPQETPAAARAPAPVEPPRPTLVLEKLFKKTKAQPHLYYLPLTEEQAAASREKRERRGKSKDERKRSVSPRRRSRSPRRTSPGRRASSPRRRSASPPPKKD